MFDTHDLQQQPTVRMETSSAFPMPASASSQLHVLDRLAAVFKHRRLAAAAFTTVVAFLMLQTYSATPMYRTSARVVIQDERSIAVGTLNANDPMFWQDSEQYYNTQYSILRSRGLAQRVVQRLRLHENPVFNGTAPKKRGPLDRVRDARNYVTSRVRGLLPNAGKAPADVPAPSESAQESALISAFLGGVEITPEPTTRIVQVGYTSSDPQFAALAANALAEEYVQQNLDLRLDSIRKNLAFLEQELTKQEAKVAEAEAAMANYREAQDALSLNDRMNIVVSRLNQLNDTVTRARTTRLQREQVWEQLKDVDPASDAADAFSAIATNPGVVAAKNRLNELRAERASAAGRYLPVHPTMQKLEAQIASATSDLVAQRARVIQTAKNEYEAALEEERSFSRSLEEQKSVAMDLDRKSGQHGMLQRAAETNRQVYQSLLQQEKELRVLSNSRANNVQVMERAEAPGGPYSPNTRRAWFTALIAGLLVAFGLAFGIEYLDDTVKTPDDIAKRLNLPLLGLVPAVRGAEAPLLSSPAPHDFGEAFRSLRTSLVFTSESKAPWTIAVTSSQPLEGKTTTACNMAIAIALGGARVLLIDGDMRRPGLHRIMGLPNTTGLSQLLLGQVRVRDVVQSTSEPNLFVMTAGKTPANPSELLGSKRMETLLDALAKGPFDCVIIDTPPVLAVTDAVLVARNVKGVVFVIGSEMTRFVHAERALELLKSGNPGWIGAVLNRVDLDRNRYYYSRYYGYHYKSYYGSNSSTL